MVRHGLGRQWAERCSFFFEDSSPDTWWTKTDRLFQCDSVDWEVEPLHKQSGGDEFGALKAAVLIVSGGGYPKPAYRRL